MAPYTIEYWDIVISILRWLSGLLLGSGCGALLAIIAVMAARWAAPLDISLHALRALPILGLLPLMQYVFGIGEIGKIILISVAALFPVYFSSLNALKSRTVDENIFFIALDTSFPDQMKLDLWPRLRRGLIQGIEVSIGLAWITVVAAESIGTYNSGFWSGGLGHKLFTAFDVNNVRAGLIALGIFGLLGLVSGYAWSRLKRAYGY
jgi:sulfonate transport system permease protein